MNSHIPLLVGIATYAIAYPLVYFILKAIEYFYGTQVAIVVGLLLVVIGLIAIWRFIVKLEGDK